MYLCLADTSLIWQLSFSSYQHRSSWIILNPLFYPELQTGSKVAISDAWRLIQVAYLSAAETCCKNCYGTIQVLWICGVSSPVACFHGTHVASKLQI